MGLFVFLGKFLEGIITEAHMSNLSKLTIMRFSYNSLAFNLNPDWFPPFRLNYISMSNCNLGPHFPKWLQSQKNCSLLDIFNTGISDIVPIWFWDLSPYLCHLNLSYNHLKGKVPDLSLKFTLALAPAPAIDLSSNCFEDSIPPFPYNVLALALSKNMFSGSISFLCAINTERLVYLDLSENHLSGEIPDCFRYWNVFILNLANNNFSGRIPNSIDPSCNIMSLHLRNNSLTGKFPSSLKNCSAIMMIDLGNNKISGTIPAWIGDSLLEVVVLSLRFNHINGSVTPKLCSLPMLQVLDFSHNNISGMVPTCLNNLSAMVQKESSNVLIEYNIRLIDDPEFDYQDQASLVWKAIDSIYKNTLGLLRCMDLSSNNLSGKIPEEITSLVGLLSLNLSENNLTGSIPPKIGQLSLLNSLDLSQNQLFGKIPRSFSQLSHLGVLNLSNNNFSGKIPSSVPLQTFEASAYMGNPELCGYPLPNKCPGEEPTHQVTAIIVHNSEEDGFVTRGLFVTTALGFIIGFWGFWGTLLLNRNWRHAYFQFLNNLEDELYVWIAVTMAKFQRRLRS